MLTTIFVLIAHMRRENFSKGRTRGGEYIQRTRGGKEIKDLSTLYTPVFNSSFMKVTGVDRIRIFSCPVSMKSSLIPDYFHLLNIEYCVSNVEY